jgi:hypothetical protein
MIGFRRIHGDALALFLRPSVLHLLSLCMHVCTQLDFFLVVLTPDWCCAIGVDESAKQRSWNPRESQLNREDPGDGRC